MLGVSAMPSAAPYPLTKTGDMLAKEQSLYKGQCALLPFRLSAAAVFYGSHPRPNPSFFKVFKCIFHLYTGPREWDQPSEDERTNKQNKKTQR